MSVWYCIPSARPVDEVKPVVEAWQERGYKVALYFDASPAPGAWSALELPPYPNSTFAYPLDGKYPGYALAVNALAEIVLQIDPSCDWIVTGGDDTYPDPNRHADEISKDCNKHFMDLHISRQDRLDMGGPGVEYIRRMSTFGVMQPTGDRFAGGCIDRIAGSPWMGREFCQRIYGGKGPLWPEFDHMFVDEHLKCVAEKLGIYWARPDLIHKHNHFQRENDSLTSRAVPRPIPEHLKKWSTKAHWDKSKAIFERLKTGGFAEALQC